MVQEESPESLRRKLEVQSHKKPIYSSPNTLSETDMSPFELKLCFSRHRKFLLLATCLVTAEQGSWDPFTTTVNAGLLCSSSSSLHPVSREHSHHSAREMLWISTQESALNVWRMQFRARVRSGLPECRFTLGLDVQYLSHVLCAPVFTALGWLTFMKKTFAVCLVEVHLRHWRNCQFSHWNS